MGSARGFIVGVVVGAAVTVGLFLLMQELIKAERMDPPEQQATPDIDIIGDDPDDLEPKPRPTPPRPDPNPEPPPPTPAPPTFPGPDRDGIGTGQRPYVPVPVPPGALPDRNEPVPIVRLSPVYPRRPLQQGLEGDVLVEFDIDENGNVLNPRVISSTNAAFEQAALRAVQRWKYAPQIRDGKPVMRRNVRVTIEFRLNEED